MLLVLPAGMGGCLRRATCSGLGGPPAFRRLLLASACLPEAGVPLRGLVGRAVRFRRGFGSPRSSR
eukprot:2924494-Alexandrium_andersonii.AAC.1